MNASAPVTIQTLHPDRVTWDAELEAYIGACEARRLSPTTIRTYRTALQSWERFMTDRGRSLDPVDATRRDAQAYLAHLAQGRSAATVKTWHVCVATFFRWEVTEALAIGDVIRSPFDGLRSPKPGAQRTPVLDDNQVDRLLAACQGARFEDVRDRAILALMLSSGLRLQEVADLLVGDVDGGVVRVVVGKGERERISALGGVAQEALRRYLRLRARHRDAALELPVGRRADRQRTGRPLWLVTTGTGHRGAFSADGIAPMVARRAAEAGIGHVHPHQLRHTWASSQLALGVPEGSVMAMGGWRSRAMLDRYTADLAQERAIAAYRDPLARGDGPRRGR